jgi:magnesium transporter
MGLTCRLYRNGTVTEEGFDPERISDLLEEPDAMIWLDLEDPSERDLRMLQKEFSLHPLAVEDTVHRDQRAKVEAYEDHFFLVMHPLLLADGEIVDSEIHVFAGPGFLVTLRYPPLFDMGPVQRRWEKQKALAAEGGGALLYTLLDEVVDDYFELIERLEDESEDVEEAVFSDEPTPDLQERMFRLKKRILLFRRRVAPLREVLDLLGEEAGLVTDPLRPYYRDVADHVLRVLEFIDNVRDLLTTGLEAHLSQTSNRLNQVMKKLTSWAAIILVPTLIAGIYGMNFIRPFPRFGNPSGFWIAIGMMGASAAVLYWVFKKRDWL